MCGKAARHQGSVNRHLPVLFWGGWSGLVCAQSSECALTNMLDPLLGLAPVLLLPRW